ncbi:ThiF family adenylyltransferase [Puerhibacterium sp. TATVAM-FAB25]|uniref:ThiF family adenylyltransferase n=1 Tax=Puerhibacterium sp. TATVAM-FAB25 TaxID=3093699 RepID=UPI00397944BE
MAAHAQPRDGTTPAPPRVPPLVAPGPALGGEDLERWSRHLLLPQLGADGQRRLRNARVCVVGAGGLGAPVLLYLAAAGVGRLGIVDADGVELSNLQRQVVHRLADVGRPKVDSAADAVRALDPDVAVVPHRTRLTPETAGLLADYDLVIDGTDNFPTRYLINDACVRLGLPEVWGSVLRFDAQVTVFWGRPPAGVPAVQLRDLFPAPPPPDSVPSCAEAGVLGALCGQVGSVMATEAIKLITGVGTPLLGRVLVLDALDARWREVPLAGGGPVPDGSAVAGARPAAAATVDAASPVPTVTARELAALLATAEAGSGGAHDGVLLVDVRQPAEREIVAIPGAVPVPLERLLTGEHGLPRGRRVVLHCRSGVRSERAARALLDEGYTDVAHLAGGVLAWVDDVAPQLPRY